MTLDLIENDTQSHDKEDAAQRDAERNQDNQPRGEVAL